MAIKWDSTLDTGIEVIDAQHRQLVAYVNQLEVAKRRNDAALAGAVLSQLVEYSHTHFGFEEAMLEDAGTLFLDVHKHEHERFIENVAALADRAAGGESVVDEAHGLVCKWLLEHLSGEDRTDIAAALARQMADAAPAAAPAAPPKKGLFGRFGR